MIKARTANMLCGNQGQMFKLRLFASLYFGSALTEFYWAWLPGWTNNNAFLHKALFVIGNSYPEKSK